MKVKARFFRHDLFLKGLLLLNILALLVVFLVSWQRDHEKALRENEEQQQTAQTALLKAPNLGSLALPAGARPYLMEPRAENLIEGEYWIQLELNRECTPELIALVPRYNSLGQPEDFPQRFRLSLSMDAHFENETILFDSSEELYRPDPRSIPVFDNPQQASCRYLRLTILPLDPSIQVPDLGYNELINIRCSLSEIQVFFGEQNLALLAPVSSSLRQLKHDPFPAKHLTDGWTPLGPWVDESIASLTEGYHSLHTPVEKKRPGDYWVQIDLGRVEPIDEIRIYPVLPRAFNEEEGYGLPHDYRVELSDTADFENPVILPGPFGKGFVRPTRQTISISGDSQSARYIRFVAETLRENRWGATFFCIAEIEVISNGRNLAKDQPVRAANTLSQHLYQKAWTDAEETLQRQGVDSPTDEEIHALVRADIDQKFEDGIVAYWIDQALVDGFGSRHAMISPIEWYRDLQEGAELQAQIEWLADQRQVLLKAQSQSQSHQVVLSASLGALLLLLSGLTFRASYKRRKESLHEELAQDLHDELASELANIALLSELASSQLKANPQDQLGHEQLDRLRSGAQLSSTTIRELIFRTQHSSYEFAKVAQVLEEIAHRRLTPLHIDYQQSEQTSLDTSVRISGKNVRAILLTFKELLTNITTHTSATQVVVRLKASRLQIQLSVEDNGKGFPVEMSESNGLNGHGLDSLRKRAKKNRGTFTIETICDAKGSPAGCEAILTLPT
ncbi:MAG: ATP-binding protein [Verrucomicrobiota bacterium]